MQTLLPFEKKQRTLLTKKESETNPKFGKEPNNLTLKELLNESVLSINKPEGPTSHQTAEYVKEILNVNKAGHGGTLDPLVTGVLPIALNNATKVLQTLLKGGKEYIALAHFHQPITKEQIQNIINNFQKKITQLPPVRSAVKRIERQRNVYYINILEHKEKELLFQIGCEAGTYIRKIIHDMGKSVNTNAHMVQLIRTKAGPFTDKEWYSLYELKDAYESYKSGDETLLKKILKPKEFAVNHLPKIYIHDSAVDPLCHGAQLTLPGISKLDDKIEPDEMIGILTLKGELLALAKSLLTSKKMIENQKGFASKTLRVFMKEGTYK